MSLLIRLSLVATFLVFIPIQALGVDLPAGVEQPLALDPGPGNPRNSEGDFIRLKSGRVLFIYTHFTGGTGDAAAAFLASRYSDDAGKTWSARDDVVVKNFAKQNVMSVSLLRLADGRIGLYFLVKNSGSDLKVYAQYSSDEAASWTEPSSCIPDAGYYVMNNNRVIQLQKVKPGRIILPVAAHSRPTDKPGFHRGIAMCFYSDDAGVTFRASESSLEAPTECRSGLQEPLVVELKDGSLMMLCRTDRGSQFRSISKDAGVKWSPAEPTDILSPLSPASIARIPKTGDLLLVWNDHTGVDPKLKGKRTPMTVAISKDEGKTWEKKKTLYSDPTGWYCYTAIAFVDSRVLLGHVAGNYTGGATGLARSAVTTFDVDWLYR